MAKVLACFNACAVGDGATAEHSGASPAASADELPIASMTELAPIYTLEGEGGCWPWLLGGVERRRMRAWLMRAKTKRSREKEKAVCLNSQTTTTTGAPAATLRYRELTAEFERVYGARPDLFARAPGAFFE